MAAPKGNQNAAKGRAWSAAIERAIANRTGKSKINALDALAEKLLSLCEQGDIAALKELGDRLDGKPAQAIIGAADDGAHIFRVEASWIEAAAKKRGWA